MAPLAVRYCPVMANRNYNPRSAASVRANRGFVTSRLRMSLRRKAGIGAATLGAGGLLAGLLGGLLGKSRQKGVARGRAGGKRERAKGKNGRVVVKADILRPACFIGCRSHVIL